MIKPCQPTLSDKAPSGPQWLHEIKHDGYRMIARKSSDQLRLWSRNGRDLSREFVAVTEARGELPVEEIALDGEAMAHCGVGLPDFHGLRSVEGGAAACLFAFDLLQLNGEDLGRCRLRSAGRGCGRLSGAQQGPALQRAPGGDGEAIFRHACALGLEGIVSKRRDARYRSGRSLTWLKIKNPAYERR